MRGFKMGARKTTQQFVDEMKAVNPSITILGEYIGNKQKIQYMCKNGHINEATPDSLLHSHGCKVCNGGTRKSHSDFVKQVETINQNTRVIGQYVNHKTPVECQCLIHNVQFSALPVSLLRGGGCTLCKNEKLAT